MGVRSSSMIHTFFALKRHSYLHPSNIFGHPETIAYHHQQLSATIPVGSVVQGRFDMFKSIETYPADGTLAVVERLYLQRGNGYLPFKTRYRTTQHQSSLIVPRVISQVQQNINDAWMCDPRLSWLESIRSNPHISDGIVETADQIIDLVSHNCPDYPLVLPEVHTADQMWREFDAMARHLLSLSASHTRTETRPIDFVRSYLQTKSPIPDVVLRQFDRQALITSSFIRDKSGRPFIDTMIPTPMAPYTAKCLHTPPDCLDLCYMLDRLRLTDLEIWYEVGNGLQVKCDRSIDLYDRYRHVLGGCDFDLQEDRFVLDQIAERVRAWFWIYRQCEDLPIHRDETYRICIRKSIQEEAMIDFTTASGQFLISIHLDLALTALTTLGLCPESPVD